MKPLPELPNIGNENAIITIATIEHSGVCTNMLYALEGEIQGIRRHGLDNERKTELREFHSIMKISEK